MTKASRILTAISALLLAGLYAFPLWRISLLAPQYPEGIGMLIRINTVTGVKEFDLKNLNELNHYIGMKLIDPDTIPELKYFPWIVAALIAAGLLVALWGKRQALYAWVGGFALLALAGLVDFWRWNYDYGHNLDFENAIIKVPGTVYQPPLFGVRQILNFRAASFPDIGGWMAFGAFALAAAALLLTWRADARSSAGGRSILGPLAAVVALLLAACAPRGPEPIAYGRENCDRCHMTISDPRFGAELITQKGKVKKFDSVECLASYVLETHGGEPPRGLWVSDHEHPGTLVAAEDAHYLQSEEAHSPMSLGVLAFASDADAKAALQRVGGRVLRWGEVLEHVAREGDRHGVGAHLEAHAESSAGLGGAT